MINSETSEEFLNQRIMEILYEGKDIKKHILIERLGLTSRQERKVRKLVEELVFKGEKIGSSSHRGFFLVKNDEDLADATKELRDKMKTLAIRANMLVKNVRGEDDPQLKLLM